VPTAQISLIREQTAAIRPPRALWVPFMLGRPFGAPHEPEFQRRVLRALLALFERRTGPVLEDFPEDAPATDAAETAFARPVASVQGDADAGDLVAAMHREIAQLAPWYDLARTRRARTTVGISGLPIDRAARHAASHLGAAPEPPYRDDLSAGMALKRCCDDLKTYYYEAAAARPENLSAAAIDRWFWRETAAARVFLALRQVCLASTDPSMRPLGEIALVPQAVIHAPGGSAGRAGSPAP
jgi:hypothetical protein